MKSKPVIPRVAAQRDVVDAIDHYLKEASAQIAEGYIDALEEAYAHIAATRPRVLPATRTSWICRGCAHGL